MQSAPLICSCPWHGEGDIGRRSCMAGGRTTLFTCPYRPASMRVSPCLRLVVVISEAVIVIGSVRHRDCLQVLSERAWICGEEGAYALQGRCRESTRTDERAPNGWRRNRE